MNSMPGAFQQDDSEIKTPQPEEVHDKEDSLSQPIMANQITSDFKWSRPDTILSPEAQKIMNSVREEASRIKAKMQAEKEQQERTDGDAEQLLTAVGRKIAKPKGKAGRYSDLHQQEFSKMDSIAGHVSAWKNRVQAGSTSLKSASNAAFIASSSTGNKTGSTLKRSASKAAFNTSSDSVDDILDSGRLENKAPGKRVKQRHHDDTSSARPMSSHSETEKHGKSSIPGLVRSKSGLPSVMTTPTKASLARATSVNRSQTSTKLPTLGRSKSFKDMAAPIGSMTEGSHKYLSSLGRMKSILHKPQPKYSNDPTKVAGGTHLPIPSSKMRVDKELPSLPGTTLDAGLLRSPSSKRVNFTPTAKATQGLAATSPSPSKLPVANLQNSAKDTAKSPERAVYAKLAAASPSPSKILAPHTLIQTKEATKSPEKIAYPPLSGPLSSNPARPGDFTFQSVKTAQFGPATSGLKSPTIRQVRPSGIATPLAPFGSVTAIAHGLSNKKRHRDDNDDDWENVPPEEEHAEGPTNKKRKTGNVLTKEKTSKPTMAEKRKAAGKGSKGGELKTKTKGILSLSRLNMLARPKERR
ncbi:hypothetical protein MMC13_003686 [Lambiella insularis]|nr:hypothetical protein [Lambiella insularis]